MTLPPCRTAPTSRTWDDPAGSVTLLVLAGLARASLVSSGGRRMTQIRIYLPLDAAGVRRLAQDREVGGSRGGGLRAFAVTEQVERDHPLGDEEEWEYAAL